VVPTGDSAWPEHLWGMKLGGNASKIRCGEAYVQHKEKLEAMGFDYGNQWKKKKIDKEPRDTSLLYF
jgi:hypothetical protein